MPKGKILTIEDDKPICELVEMILDKNGFEVISYSSRRWIFSKS